MANERRVWNNKERETYLIVQKLVFRDRSSQRRSFTVQKKENKKFRCLIFVLGLFGWENFDRVELQH